MLNTIKDDYSIHKTRQGENNHPSPKFKAPNDLANTFLCVWCCGKPLLVPVKQTAMNNCDRQH